jgi:hypothetical protein
MAQTSWPFENIDTSETQFSQWARNIGEGVKQNTLDELEPFADSSGMQVKVRSGQALIRGHYYQNSAEATLSVTASDPTNPRIDNVVLELDPSANSVVLKVVAGTPASSPTAPTVVQTDGGIYQLKLAEVLVGAGVTGIASGDVTDTRPMLTSAADLAPLLDTKVDLAVDVLSKTANYTLQASDTSDFIAAEGTFTITVPANVFSAGERVDVVNVNSGVITFAAGAGLTLNSVDDAVTIDTQWAGVSVFFTSATTAVLVGRLA